MAGAAYLGALQQTNPKILPRLGCLGDGAKAARRVRRQKSRSPGRFLLQVPSDKAWCVVVVCDPTKHSDAHAADVLHFALTAHLRMGKVSWMFRGIFPKGGNSPRRKRMSVQARVTI